MAHKTLVAVEMSESGIEQIVLGGSPAEVSYAHILLSKLTGELARLDDACRLPLKNQVWK